MRVLFLFFSILWFAPHLSAQIATDSVPAQPIQEPPITIETYYQTRFGIFDQQKTASDTLYLKPLVLQPKIRLMDTIRENRKGVEQVFVNTYWVKKDAKTSTRVFYNAPRKMELYYDSIPTFKDPLPFDALHLETKSFSYWKKENELGLDISQSSFSNWNAGGNNSIAGLLKLDFRRKYEKGRHLWNNYLKVRYGLNKQDERETRKTDDVLLIESTYGYQTSVTSKWYYTAKLSLNTQFTDGYSYPDTENPISKFAAPLYLFSGIGAEYSSKNKSLTAYFSPSTLKSTFVLDDTLAAQGAFGVEPAIYDTDGNLIKEGEYARHEFGFLITANYKRALFKNVTLSSTLNLYTDYLTNFGNVDIDWQMQLDFKINNLLKATIGGHFIYDDDIKTTETINDEKITKGPKLQIKQIIGIGLSYTF